MNETLTEIGQYNTLRVLRLTEFGAYLDGLNEGDILLPGRFVPPDLDVGDEIKVFICYDSEDRLMATTEEPFAQVGEFALLRVVSTTGVGSFFDWGLSKDLFLPFAEQTRSLRVGQDVIVRVYLDKSGRISSSMKLDKFLEKEDALQTIFKNGQEVELLIVDETDLGLKAMVDNKRWGVLYKNETFKPLRYGDRIKGKIKLVRPDGKLDLMLDEAPVGHHAVQGEIGPQILARLQEEGGFLNVTDKTDPEVIYDLFGVSKKKFKMALSGLYKQRRITVDPDGIRLVKA